MLNIQSKSPFGGQFSRWMRAIAVMFAVAALVACGGNTEGEGASSSQQKTDLMVSLTDAEGDFLIYEVDVTSISLAKANGTEVQVLPNSTTVDFAQYVDVTELLTIAEAPTGIYRSAVLTIDFSAATIVVQAEDGSPIEAAVVDSDGDPLNEVEVPLSFNGREGFALFPGIPAHVTLDFDLDASNDIAIDEEGEAVVTVNPVFMADTIWNNQKTFRLRGTLGAVAVDRDVFAIDLRPFRVRTGAFGSAHSHVTSETIYEIDGVVYEGDAGLVALQELSFGSPVVTEGGWNRISKTYTASQVFAGSSVPWGEADVLRGTVTSRTENSVTVRGAVIQFAEGHYVFNDDISVSLSEFTNVIKRGEGEASISQISVGTAVYAVGEFNSEAGDLDATQGWVRLVPSSVAGTVVSAAPLVLDVSLLNARQSSIYNTAGTGTSLETDADMENYEISTSTISLGSVNLGDPVRARGYVSDFGTAPEDFNASTVINAANMRAHMVATYTQGGTLDVDESGLTLGSQDLDDRHHIVRAGITTDLLGLVALPSVVPANEQGIYAITYNGVLEVYAHYDDYVEALNDYVSVEGAMMTRFDAQGYFDSQSNEFTSNVMRVQLSVVSQ